MNSFAEFRIPLRLLLGLLKFIAVNDRFRRRIVPGIGIVRHKAEALGVFCGFVCLETQKLAVPSGGGLEHGAVGLVHLAGCCRQR